MKVGLFIDEGGDWIALYREGVLVAEGHSLDPAQVITALGFEYESKWRDMSHGEPCPQGWDEIK